MTDSEITIIGAGVIGLAIAEHLSKKYPSVFLVEKERTFGQETSSRNSEVIHAGLYYPENSLKATLCVEGKELLYSFCKKWDVPYNNCGKLIVATSEKEKSVIDGIIRNASKNSVTDLRVLDKNEISELEPNIFAVSAIYSPSTGIIDTHSLMKQLETNFINNGGTCVYKSEVIQIEKIEEGYELTVAENGGTDFTFTSQIVINSAGLAADKVSALLGIEDPALTIRYCKGEYFRLKPPKNRLINRLIYPVPIHDMEGIGIHVTIDMGGGVKLGPDVTWLNENVRDYTVDPSKQESFYKSVKKYLPFVEYDDIFPEMAGIRPKIQKPGDSQKDFYIKEESHRGFPGFINLIGMESPGLTSCLSIAEHLGKMI